MKTLLLLLLLVFACSPAALAADFCMGCDVPGSCWQCHGEPWSPGYDAGRLTSQCVWCVNAVPNYPSPERADPRSIHGITGRGQDLIAAAEGYIRGLIPSFAVKSERALLVERITRFGKSPEHAAIMEAARLQSRSTVCSARIVERIRILKRDRL